MTARLSRRRRLATAQLRLAELPVIELPGGLRVYEARSWAARRDGLGGLPDLPDDWGLWIAPCRSIHTLGMRFALDLVWLDGDDEVRGVVGDVAPRRQRSDLRARSVIEVARGRGDAFAAAWPARARTPLPGPVRGSR
ncbi:MAG: uncharacterized protein QOJ89_3056 [bacterium]|jgi:uncharacterized membrane protein (UPF0127 family)